MFKKISFYALIFVTIISQSTIAGIIAGNEINIIQDDSSTSHHTVDTPTQIGIASKTTRPIRQFGLYQLYSNIDDDTPINPEENVYNVGKKLPIIDIDGVPTVFVRRINDLYNDCNYLWKGNLQFYDSNGLRQDQAGYTQPHLPIASKSCQLMPFDGYNRIIDNTGKLWSKFQHHINNYYNHNGNSAGATGNSPALWYNRTAKSGQDLQVKLSTPGVTRLNPTDPNSLVKLTIAFYDDNNGKYTDRFLRVFINGRADYINCRYTGRGYKIFEAYFPIQWLDRNEASGFVWNDHDTSQNKVEFLIQHPTGSGVKYDYSEIHIPTATNSDGYYELYSKDQETSRYMLYVDKSFSGNLKFSGARHAINISKFGAEQLIASDDDSLINVSILSNQEAQSFYLTNNVEKVEFGNPKTLTRVDDIANKKNITVATQDINYFTKFSEVGPSPESSSVLDVENWFYTLGGPVVAPWMTKSYSSNNYDVWANYRHNGKTMLELQGETAPTKLLKFEDIADVYGGGIYSPYGLTNFLRENSDTINHVTLVGGTFVNYKKINIPYYGEPVQSSNNGNKYRCLITKPPQYITYPGIPTGFIYGSQLGTTGSDDIFAVDNPKTFSDLARLKRSVSRVLTVNDDDLRAWIDRRIDFKPSDNMGLWVGDNDTNLSFTHEQEKHRGKLPSVLLDINSDIQMGITPKTGEGIDNGKNNRSERSAAMREMIDESISLGYRLHIYQGHGSWLYLSNNRIFDTFETYYKNNMFFPTIPAPSLPTCQIWATCYGSKFHFMGYTSAYDRNKFYTNASMLFQLTKGTSVVDSEGTYNIPASNLENYPEMINGGYSTDKEPDNTKGVVNVIASTSLAEASWEDDFCNAFINYVRDNPDATWGEAFIHAKKAVRYIQSNATYNLYGDPTLRVRPQTARTIEIENKNLYYKKSNDAIQVKLQGDWLNLENRPYNDTIYYTTKVNGVLTENKIGEINLSNYTTEEFNNGVIIDISTENFFNLTNYQLVFFSKENFRNLGSFDYDTTTVDTDSIITEWFISDKFTVDGITPQTFTYYSPSFGDNIIDNRIVIEVSHAIDNESGLAGYKYELTNTDTNEVFYSNGGTELTYSTSFIFAPYLAGFENMKPGHYTFQVYAYDKAGNERVMRNSGGVPINWKVGFVETDLDGDSIPDEWEKIYFDGDTDFITDTNQDSDGDGISDYDEYYYGTHPYQITVSIKEGWNLLSIPCNLDQESIDKLALLDSEMGYTYNATTQMYESVSIFSNLSASTGYWYFSWSDLEDFTITGSPSKQGTEMLPTWNLIGPYAATTVSDHTTVNDAIFSWEGSEFSEYLQLSDPELIYPAIGYWFYNGNAQSRSVILK